MKYRFEEARYGALSGMTPFCGYVVTVREGTGVADDPFRTVAYWFKDDGFLIRRDDPRAELEA